MVTLEALQGNSVDSLGAKVAGISLAKGRDSHMHHARRGGAFHESLSLRPHRLWGSWAGFCPVDPNGQACPIAAGPPWPAADEFLGTQPSPSRCPLPGLGNDGSC